MSFVRNAWYVVGWSHAIPTTLEAHRILDEDIVVYRTQDNTVVALEDQCPHKRLPLSLGRLDGDSIECGYHGMTFGPDGRCVRVPGLKRPPESAWVRHFPTHEASGIVWIWMGDPQLADAIDIFDLAQLHAADWATQFGDGLHFDANYLHLADNLCDPAHVAFVHPTTLGNPQSAGVPVNVEMRDGALLTSRWVRDAPPIGFFKAFGNFSANVDRWHYYYFHAPNIAVIDFGSIDTAVNAGEAEREHGIRLFALHFLTPVSETQTIDHWMHVRNVGVTDPDMGERMNEQFRVAFAEDKVVLEAIQRREDKPRTRPPVPLAIDKGTLLMKRLVSELVERENTPGA
ncbi:MAG: aromatic ring-hydroxylating dioxygenase subunit alpha [Chromatiales bacterium]|jgi:phenylpropionate dioxygenase-like ring-hydroxylating dioxygenase large terminal subunit|nr:aromatic ring-hydroxylating dioxygenase subunit alpha [Chromatiales bacterium]